ncbi:hypothetical protein KCU93_g9440, partial [Aureobasidium melanogenum]
MKYDGAKNFEDGSLNDIANVRLIFQGIEGKLCIATLDASSKEWKYPTVGVDPASLPDMLRGGSLTACITKSDNDSNKDIFSVFYQDAKDATLKEYRLDFSSGEPAPKMTNGSKIFANATSIGAGVLAFMDGVVPALVALTHSNAIVSVTAKDKDSPDKGWNDPKSVTDGTKSAGLAAMAWPEKDVVREIIQRDAFALLLPLFLFPFGDRSAKNPNMLTRAFNTQDALLKIRPNLLKHFCNPLFSLLDLPEFSSLAQPKAAGHGTIDSQNQVLLAKIGWQVTELNFQLLHVAEMIVGFGFEARQTM